jgi:hypothetical protein
LDLREIKQEDDRENCTVLASYLVQFTKYYEGDEIKDDEMGKTHSMHAEMRQTYKILIKKSIGNRTLPWKA